MIIPSSCEVIAENLRSNNIMTDKQLAYRTPEKVGVTFTNKTVGVDDIKKKRVLERATTHPLQKKSEDSTYNSPFLESSSGSSVLTHESYTSSSIHTHTASLLQVAARSILDSPDTCNNPHLDVSYDEDVASNNSSCSGSRNRLNEKNKRCGHSLCLTSLQKEILPALPEEQDRKRFIGCLASILASLYSYDTDSAMILDESNEYERGYTSSVMNEKQDRYSESTMDPRKIFLSMTTSGSFSQSDSPSFDSSFLNCGGTSFIPDNVKMNDSPYKQRRRNDGTTSFRDCSEIRSRKRRYEVLSRLLLKSAELLKLDKNHAKCFLPMLSKNLAPSDIHYSIHQSNSRIRQRHVTNEVLSSPQLSMESGTNPSFLETKMDEIEHLRPFLESLSPGSGLRCLSMFLIQFLLCSEEGYDSRVRYAVKTLGVLLIMHDMERDGESYISTGDATMLGLGFTADNIKDSIKRSNSNGRIDDMDLRTKATRYFESLESVIASKLIQLSREQTEFQKSKNVGDKSNTRMVSNSFSRPSRGLSNENFMRGLKIGGTAVAAGALFAFTGGLAAPGIAAGIAAIAGGTAVTAAAAALLTSTVAVTAIFGVGGGGLAAYKMQRRTIGLTEFEFVKEDCDRKTPTSYNQSANDSNPEAELFSTVCLSGWLRDNCDFQRPWGVAPTRPRITDRTELLERFYSIYSPDHIPKCAKILASWKGEESNLWNVLRQKYGRDPNHLFPLEPGPRACNSLTHEQREIVDRLFRELGYATVKEEVGSQRTPLQRLLVAKKASEHMPFTQIYENSANGSCLYSTEFRLSMNDSLHGPNFRVSFPEEPAAINLAFSSDEVENRTESNASSKVPKHLATVWDYRATYGGELYTVRWETDLLTELCDSVADLAFDVVSGGTAHLLKFTALSTLLSAMAWPYALINAANMIDATWTLVIERADEAGKELARSLLFSTAGNRPVTLIGYSFGARAIYSCLKELVRYQEAWELFHEKQKGSNRTKPLQRDVELKEGSDTFYMNMREPASIVEDVVLMGLPNHLSLSSWKACRQIVAGRLTNCFSQKDLILSLMFQIKKFGLKPVCGTCQVNVAGVENVDVTDLISGHQDYCLNVGAILKRIRHGEPFPSSAPSHIDSEFNANDVAREVAKLDVK